MKRGLRNAAIVVLVGALGAAGAYAVSRNPALVSARYNLRLATGPVGSDGQKALSAFVRELAEEHPLVRIIPVPFENLSQTGRALAEGRADLAVVRSDDEAAASGRTIFVLRRTGIGILLAPDSKIENVSELLGKKLAVAEGDRQDPGLLKAALDFYGLRATDLIEMAQPQFGPALKAKRVAAIIVFGPLGSGPIADAVTAVRKSFKEPPKFLDIEEADAIAARWPVYESIEIKQGAFGGAPSQPGEAINTIAVSQRLVSSSSLPNRVAGELTRVLLATKPKLIATVPAAAQMEAPDTAKTSLLPVHPGTLAYLNGEQESLLNETTNYYFLALMIFAVVAPLVGWISSRRGNRRGREARLKLFQLAEIARLAKSGSSDQLVAADEELQNMTEWLFTKLAQGEIERDHFQCIERMISQLRGTIERRAIGIKSQSLMTGAA